MKINRKRSPLISLALSLGYPSAIMFWTPSFCQAEAVAPQIGPEDPQPDIHPSEWDQDISHWKTYRNEKYQIEFKYPPSFIVEVREFFKNEMGPDAIANVDVSDSNFVGVEGMVGADWRGSRAYVGLEVSRFSEQKWKAMQDQIGEELTDDFQKKFEDFSSRVKTDSGEVQTYVYFDGLVGYVLKSNFSNKQYIYSMWTYSDQFAKLGRDILSTWKGPNFTKGKERVVPNQSYLKHRRP